MLLVVGLARVYLGYHHPTDILVGALLGIGMVLLVTIPGVKNAVTRRPMQWELRHPSSFHAALFVMVSLIAVTSSRCTLSPRSPSRRPKRPSS